LWRVAQKPFESYLMLI